RFVIEHPRWIPKEDLATLDVRAGAGMGRIYRVRPAGTPVRPWPRLDRLDTAGLVATLDSPNGTVRDLAGQMLLWRNDPSAAPALEKLARGQRPEARLHALCVLAGLGKLSPKLVRAVLADPHPGVRRHAVRLAEAFLKSDPGLGSRLAKLAEDRDAQVRLQVACTLGEWRDRRAAGPLAALALAHAGDPHLVAAVLSSLHSDNLGGVLTAVLAARAPSPELARRLLDLAVSTESTALPAALER